MIKFSDEYKPQPDELISKNKVLMMIADYQMGTDPHSEEGKFEYEILEFVFDHIKEMAGINTCGEMCDMSDLISRDDAIRALNGSCSNWEDDAKVQEIIMAIPSADAVDVAHDIPEYCSWSQTYTNMVQGAMSKESAEAKGRVISAEKLKRMKFVVIKGDKTEEAYRKGWNGAIECVIDNVTPSAEAVQDDECDHCVYKWGTKGGEDE